MHRPVEGAIKTVTLKRELSKWYVVFSCDVSDATPLPVTGQSVGIDVGLTHFLTTDTGATVDNPRPFKGAQRRLRVAQRALARCKRGGGRLRKARRRVALLHQNELGVQAVRGGHPQRGASLLAAAAALRRTMGTPVRPADQAAIEGALLAARTSLGDTTFAEAWATGQTLPVEQLVAQVATAPDDGVVAPERADED